MSTTCQAYEHVCFDLIQLSWFSVFVCWIFVFFSTTIQYFVQAFMDLCCCFFLVLLRNFYSTHTQPILYCRHTDSDGQCGKRDEKVWKALQNVKKVNQHEIYMYTCIERRVLCLSLQIHVNLPLIPTTTKKNCVAFRPIFLLVYFQFVVFRSM